MIRFLYNLRWFGAKLGLDNTFKLAALAGNPQQANSFGNGWIIKVEMSDPSELNKLLSAADYQKLLK